MTKGLSWTTPNQGICWLRSHTKWRTPFSRVRDQIICTWWRRTYFRMLNWLGGGLRWQWPRGFHGPLQMREVVHTQNGGHQSIGRVRDRIISIWGWHGSVLISFPNRPGPIDNNHHRIKRWWEMGTWGRPLPPAVEIFFDGVPRNKLLMWTLQDGVTNWGLLKSWI